MVLVSLPSHKFMYPSCYYSLQEIKNAVGMSSIGIMFTPNFLKIGSLIQTLIGTQTAW